MDTPASGSRADRGARVGPGPLRSIAVSAVVLAVVVVAAVGWGVIRDEHTNAWYTFVDLAFVAQLLHCAAVAGWAGLRSVPVAWAVSVAAMGIGVGALVWRIAAAADALDVVQAASWQLLRLLIVAAAATVTIGVSIAERRSRSRAPDTRAPSDPRPPPASDGPP